MKKNIIIGVLFFLSIILLLFAFVAKTQAEEAKKNAEMMTIEAEMQKQIAIECVKQAQMVTKQHLQKSMEMTLIEAQKSADEARELASE